MKLSKVRSALRIVAMLPEISAMGSSAWTNSPSFLKRCILQSGPNVSKRGWMSWMPQTWRGVLAIMLALPVRWVRVGEMIWVVISP